MKKKLIALFAACSMITTAAVGLAQTAYAADPGISVVVTDGASANQKVLTYYYNNMAGIMDSYGYFDVDTTATIDSVVLTVSGLDCEADKKDTDDVPYGYFIIGNGGKAITSDDNSFLIVTMTVPEGEEVETTLTMESFRDSDGTNYTFDPIVEKVSATPPEPATVPAAVTAVEKQNTEAINGTGEYETQTADIYGVEITPNDESVSGATVSVGEKTKDITFKTVYSGKGTVVFAVILASESGDPLPTLSADNVTPIVATID